MDKIVPIQSVTQFNTERGHKTLHPLVSVLDQSKSIPIKETRYFSELYIVFLKELQCGTMKYGRSNYDYQDGTMLFISPGQVFGFSDSDQEIQPTGWALVFHPDLIKGTSFGRQIKEYGFFSYTVNEALHLSDTERLTMIEIFKKILSELEQTIDKHSKSLIISNIELFLKYCVRYYDRQFITRDNIHKDSLMYFESLLNNYFESDKPKILGLPTVSYCASQLNLSANYFGDLIKKETGKSALEYIHTKVIDIAKEKIQDNTKSISEISFEIGFKYPPHFSRLFKQYVGQTPNEYRALN